MTLPLRPASLHLGRRQRIREGLLDSLKHWVRKLGEDHIANRNRAPKPFAWTAKASDIQEKVKRARATLDKSITG